MINIKKYCQNAILGIAVGASLLSLPGIPQFFSERINNNDQLQKIIEEEKVKIGLQKMKITGYLNYNGNALMRAAVPAYACRYRGPSIIFHDGNKVQSEDYSIIVIRSEIGMRRGIIKHELMHIANKDKGMKASGYWTHGEFLANLYGSFGLDLKRN